MRQSQLHGTRTGRLWRAIGVVVIWRKRIESRAGEVVTSKASGCLFAGIKVDYALGSRLEGNIRATSEKPLKS